VSLITVSGHAAHGKPTHGPASPPVQTPNAGDRATLPAGLPRGPAPPEVQVRQVEKLGWSERQPVTVTRSERARPGVAPPGGGKCLSTVEGWLGEELEGVDVAGADDAEVAVVEGGDLGEGEAFGDGDEAGVGAA
jgi:hypothetical protein